MSAIMWTAELQYPLGTEITPEYTSEVVDFLGPSFHPAVAPLAGGHLSVRVTFAAENSDAAWRTAFDVVTAAVNRRSGVGSGTMPDFVEVMTEKAWDAREGFVHVPDLVSVTEAAELLGVSRQRVLQMVEEGKFSTATKVGSTTVIARGDVEAKRKAHGDAVSRREDREEQIAWRNASYAEQEREAAIRANTRRPE